MPRPEFIAALNYATTTFFGRGKRNVAAIGLALLLSCCSHPWEPEIDRNVLACRQYGFYPNSQQFEECMRYVERSNRTTLLPAPAPRQP
jgi:hypothetical protein